MKKLLDRKIEFEEIFKFTDSEGKTKSLDWLYILALSLTILFSYFAVQHFFTLGFEKWFQNLSRAMLNVLDIGVPAIIATAVFCGIYMLLKNKTIMPVSYAVSLFLTILVIIFMLIKYDKETAFIAIPVVFYMFFIPVAFGCLCIWLMYFHFRKKYLLQQEDK